MVELLSTSSSTRICRLAVADLQFLVFSAVLSELATTFLLSACELVDGLHALLFSLNCLDVPPESQALYTGQTQHPEFGVASGFDSALRDKGLFFEVLEVLSRRSLTPSYANRLKSSVEITRNFPSSKSAKISVSRRA